MSYVVYYNSNFNRKYLWKIGSKSAFIIILYVLAKKVIVQIYFVSYFNKAWKKILMPDVHRQKSHITPTI